MIDKLYLKCYIFHVFIKKTSLLIYYSLGYDLKYRYTYLYQIKHKQEIIGIGGE